MSILFEERVAWLKFSDKNKEIQVQYIFHTRRLPTIRFLERKKERRKKVFIARLANPVPLYVSKESFENFSYEFGHCLRRS